MRCKFMDVASGRKGCQLWEWLDDDQTEWQKNIINQLVEEKKQLTAELESMKATMGSPMKATMRTPEHEFTKVNCELDTENALLKLKLELSTSEQWKQSMSV
ncbi:A-kinase anchor protein SPHKAP [Bienertia sinuspersici]